MRCQVACAPCCDNAVNCLRVKHIYQLPSYYLGVGTAYRTHLGNQLFKKSLQPLVMCAHNYVIKLEAPEHEDTGDT